MRRSLLTVALVVLGAVTVSTSFDHELILPSERRTQRLQSTLSVLRAFASQAHDDETRLIRVSGLQSQHPSHVPPLDHYLRPFRIFQHQVSVLHHVRVVFPSRRVETDASRDERRVLRRRARRRRRRRHRARVRAVVRRLERERASSRVVQRVRDRQQRRGDRVRGRIRRARSTVDEGIFRDFNALHHRAPRALGVVRHARGEDIDRVHRARSLGAVARARVSPSTRDARVVSGDAS